MVSIGLRQGIRLEQSLKLTQSQRLELKNQIINIRLDLLETLRGERYQPEGQCPGCGRELTAAEIIAGFRRNDVNDFTTLCTACGERFEPKLINFRDGSRLEIPFFCDNQALHKLVGMKSFSPEEIAREIPGVYRSAVIHYGSIKRAFERLGIEYSFNEILDWRNKIRPFLGRLPDSYIAGVVSVSAGIIRRMRIKAGIPVYRASRSLEELEEMV